MVLSKRNQQLQFVAKHCKTYLRSCLLTEYGSRDDTITNVSLRNQDFELFENLEKRKGFRKVNDQLKMYATDSKVRSWNLKALKPEVQKFSLSDELLSLSTTNLSMAEFQRQQTYKDALREADFFENDHFWRHKDYTCLKFGVKGSDFHSVIPAVQQCLIEARMLALEKMKPVFQGLTDYDKSVDRHTFFGTNKSAPLLLLLFVISVFCSVGLLKHFLT